MSDILPSQKASSIQNNLLNLPTEIISNILSYIYDPYDVNDIMLTCKHLNYLTKYYITKLSNDDFKSITSNYVCNFKNIIEVMIPVIVSSKLELYNLNKLIKIKKIKILYKNFNKSSDKFRKIKKLTHKNIKLVEEWIYGRDNLNNCNYKFIFFRPKPYNDFEFSKIKQSVRIKDLNIGFSVKVISGGYVIYSMIKKLLFMIMKYGSLIECTDFYVHKDELASSMGFRSSTQPGNTVTNLQLDDKKCNNIYLPDLKTIIWTRNNSLYHIMALLKILDIDVTIKMKHIFDVYNINYVIERALQCYGKYYKSVIIEDIVIDVHHLEDFINLFPNLSMVNLYLFGLSKDSPGLITAPHFYNDFNIIESIFNKHPNVKLNVITYRKEDYYLVLELGSKYHQIINIKYKLY